MINKAKALAGITAGIAAITGGFFIIAGISLAMSSGGESGNAN